MCEGGIHQQRTRGPIPIIVCCKTEHVAAGVIQSLKPEYDGGLRFYCHHAIPKQIKGEESVEEQKKEICKYTYSPKN